MTSEEKTSIISFFSTQYSYQLRLLKKLQEESGQESYAEKAAAIATEAGIMGALRTWREAACVIENMETGEVKP